jgi:hypothetical protein
VYPIARPAVSAQLMLQPTLLAGEFAPASAQNIPANAPVIGGGQRAAAIGDERRGVEHYELPVNGEPMTRQVQQTARDVRPLGVVQLASHTDVVINHAPGFAIPGPFPEAGPGRSSNAVRVVDALLERDALLVRLDGAAGADPSFRLPAWKWFADRHLGS